MKLYLYIIFISIFSTSAFAQLNNLNIGGGVGLGTISGNLPSQTSFGSKIFIETEPFIKPFNSLQLSFTFAQKLEKLLPGSRNISYYPFLKSFSLTANGKQYLNDNIFVGEGFGFLFLNDRTFDDVNTWNYGMAINLFVGTKVNTKIDLTFNLDYGLTLNNTNVSLVLFMLNVKYSILNRQ